NIVIDSTILSNIPSATLTVLSLQNVSVPADTDFSGFSLLEELNVSDNTSFTISSSDVFPSLLQSLDISGCTSITDLSFLPTSLVNLSIEGLSISESSLLADFTVLETLNASSTGLTDWDLFSRVGLSSLTTLLLSNNSLTDISLLYQLDSLVTLDGTDNKLCNVNNSAFDTFFSNATVTVGSDTDFDQDSDFCGQCSVDYSSILPSSNIVCREIWTDVYRADCAMFSYRDYSSTD
ncbi:hypothetical protein ADUPG1_002550, partial [Aduncisulcus paluster]